jgi:hypothetical protein
MVCLAGLTAAVGIAGCEQVTVRGPEGKQMTICLPASVTIHRAETEILKVNIKRTKFTDAVTVTLAQLPKGVEADESSKTVETDMVTFTLKADPMADLVHQQEVRVMAEGPDGMRATAYFKLSVKP